MESQNAKVSNELILTVSLEHFASCATSPLGQLIPLTRLHGSDSLLTVAGDAAAVCQ